MYLMMTHLYCVSGMKNGTSVQSLDLVLPTINIYSKWQSVGFHLNYSSVHIVVTLPQGNCKKNIGSFFVDLTLVIPVLITNPLVPTSTPTPTPPRLTVYRSVDCLPIFLYCTPWRILLWNRTINELLGPTSKSPGHLKDVFFKIYKCYCLEFTSLC